MAFKPNYNQQRADRNRGQGAKEAGKAEASRRGDGEAQGGTRRRSPSPTRRPRTPSSEHPGHGQEDSKRVRTASCCSTFSTRTASQTSNRKVPAAELGGLDGDEPARTIVEVAGSRDRRDVRAPARPHQVDQARAQGLGRKPV